MNLRYDWRKLVCVAYLAAWVMAVHPEPAVAQSLDQPFSPFCQEVAEYQDINGDGRTDAMALNCQFAEGSSDRLTVYRTGGITDGVPWQQNITYVDETWVFDHGAQNRASLIASFRRDGAALVAELYDDRNADGEVGYAFRSGQVVITESPYWTVQVTAPDGWWMRNGALNYNLHIQIDGDVEGMFMMETYRGSLVTDGIPDYEIQVYDQNNSGKPELDRRRILTDWLQEAVGLQTQMMLNWEDNELPITSGFDLWPYLDLSHEQTRGSRILKGYERSAPPLKFSPSTGRIEAVGEFVASRSGENNCFFYSALPWVAGEVNQTDFESPFCFYDLASDSDRFPELQVRAVSWPANDFYFLQGASSQPYQLIRYSWDQENATTWRYAVGLIGRHEIDSAVTLADYEVETIPYELFPTWVVERPWDMAVFSEYTGKTYFTSEGDYSVSYLEATRFAEYYSGLSASMPAPGMTPNVGFKMEWAPDHSRQPYLYFSPIDRRLHLMGASGGAWTVSENQSIRYANLDGDDYLDRWEWVVDGQIAKSLYVLNDFIMQFENNSISLQRTQAPKHLFITLPPTNHEEWLRLSADLAQNQLTFASDDLAAMAAQFGEPFAAVNGLSIRDFRMVDDGFRFILSLADGFEVSGEDVLGVVGLAPGEYAVTYDSTFHVQPLTPAAIRAEVIRREIDGLHVQFGSHNLRVVVRNEGLEDASHVRVRASMVEPEGEELLSEIKILTVLAGETAAVNFPWAPDSPGHWTVNVQADLLDERLLRRDSVTAEQVVEVLPAQETTLYQDVSALGVIRIWQFIALVIVLITASGLTVWWFSRAAVDKAEQD